MNKLVIYPFQAGLITVADSGRMDGLVVPYGKCEPIIWYWMHATADASPTT